MKRSVGAAFWCFGRTGGVAGAGMRGWSERAIQVLCARSCAKYGLLGFALRKMVIPGTQRMKLAAPNGVALCWMRCGSPEIALL